MYFLTEIEIVCNKDALTHYIQLFYEKVSIYLVAFLFQSYAYELVSSKLHEYTKLGFLTKEPKSVL